MNTNSPLQKNPGFWKDLISFLLQNKKSLEQVQLCLGVPAPPITDDNRYATLILNTVLGGGMSSRLFQTIREERGMAYSISTNFTRPSLPPSRKTPNARLLWSVSF